MIARPLPYSLSPFQAALDALVARLSSGAATVEELMAAGGEARDLFESMVAANPPDRTGAELWSGRFDGQRLAVTGPRVTAMAGYESGVLGSLVLNSPAGSFELTLEPASARVRLTDAAGGVLAHYTVAANGSVHDERERPPDVLGVDDLFGPPVAAPLFEAVKPPPAAAPLKPPAPAAAVPGKQWYYVADGKPEGPLPESELRNKLRSLPLAATMVWNEDLPEWKTAEAVGLKPAAAPAPAAAPVPVPVPRPAPASVAAPVAAPVPEIRNWELAIRAGAPSGGPCRLSGEVRIGRNPECEVCLSDGMASRVHAFVRQKPDGFWVFDNQSLNGTELNGVKLGEPRLLKPGDTIRIGDTELVFRAAGGAAAAPEHPAATIRQGSSPLAPAPPQPGPPERPMPLFAERPAPVIPARPAPVARPAPAPEPAAALKFCTDCGGRNHGDAAFCVHCGRRLGA